MVSLCIANKVATYISGLDGSPTSQGEASLECSILDHWDQMGRMGWDGSPLREVVQTKAHMCKA